VKKAINYWSFAGKTIKESMQLAKQAGFDGIELTLEENGQTGLNSTASDWAELSEHAQQLGLQVPSIATGLHWGNPITANDPETRKKAIQIVEKQLEMAQAFGADSVLVVPGLVAAVFMPGFTPIRYDIAYDRAFEAFSYLKEKAETAKIKIGLENVWNQFLLSPLEMRDFIDKLNSPYIKAYFDVGNVIHIGYPEQWIEILGDRICKIHFKDYKRSIGGLDGFVEILAGDVNWRNVMAALKSINYDDWVTAEIGAYAAFPEQSIFNTAAAMDKILTL